MYPEIETLFKNINILRDENKKLNKSTGGRKCLYESMNDLKINHLLLEIEGLGYLTRYERLGVERAKYLYGEQL